MDFLCFYFPLFCIHWLMGNSLTIPITNGKLNLGTWQGLYLCEFRYEGGSRHLVATITGE